MTLIEGASGVIVVDPWSRPRPGVAGLALYRSQRGERAVSGVVFTHSHLDHFGRRAVL
jgi:alkyl sulfatase BDS1-like metallo-beta-lactamase superfamily hydrolase